MYCALWEFRVQPGSEAAFESAYGPDGDWARLFRRDSAFVRTELLRDRSRPGRYLTADFWTDAGAFAAFRKTFGAEYDALDRRCEAYTLSERKLGEFEMD
jgi:heme-degrading monooxygenase HmoA